MLWRLDYRDVQHPLIEMKSGLSIVTMKVTSTGLCVPPKAPSNHVPDMVPCAKTHLVVLLCSFLSNRWDKCREEALIKRLNGPEGTQNPHRVELDTPENFCLISLFLITPTPQHTDTYGWSFPEVLLQSFSFTQDESTVPPSQRSEWSWWFVLEAQYSSGWAAPDNSVHIRTAHSGHQAKPEGKQTLMNWRGKKSMAMLSSHLDCCSGGEFALWMFSHF